MARKGPAPSPAEQPDVSSGFDWGQFTPGVRQGALINARRYGNTLVSGGFMDVAGVSSARKIRRAQKYGAFVGGNYNQSATAASFMGGSARSRLTRSPFLTRRAANAVSKGKDPFFNPFKANNLNPRATNRFHSISALGGGDITGGYNPFNQLSAATNKVGMFAAKHEGLRKTMGIADDFDPKTDKVFTGGVLGRIDSLNKLHGIEHTIRVGEASGGATALEGRALKKFTRAQAQRATMVENIKGVQSAANPAMNAVQGSRAVRLEAQLARSASRRSMMAGSSILSPGTVAPVSAMTAASRGAGITATATANATAATNAAAIAANPSNAIASTMTKGTLSNRITSFYNGALNAENMSTRSLATLNKGFKVMHGGDKVASRAAMTAFKTEMSAGGAFGGNALMRGIGGGKTIGTGFKMMRAGARSEGMLAMRLGGTRMLGAAMGPLSIISNAQLMYDIGKGVGKIAVGGMNFAKDAIKSMQGSINKPMFGTGFKDNEVAATSRSRGVMAIQNSRLNARSLLGSEAGMMAAHFG
jgi:hypothetical protein